MAMKASDYETMGREVALLGTHVKDEPRAGWQRAAWDRGYISGATARRRTALVEVGTFTKKMWTDIEPNSNDSIRIAQMPANTIGWPRGAAEHAMRLALDLNKEKSLKRRERLRTALRRMQKRHGHLTPAHALELNEGN